MTTCFLLYARMWIYLGDKLLENVKNEIREKQIVLNELMSGEYVDKNEAMKLSIELDELISQYYKVIFVE